MTTFPTSPIDGQIFSTPQYDYIWNTLTQKWVQKQNNPSIKHQLYNDVSNLTFDLSKNSSFEISATRQSLDTEITFTNPPAESGKFTVKVKNDYDAPGTYMSYTGNRHDLLYPFDGIPETQITSVSFKPDGTKMYVSGFNDRLFELDLSTPWDIQSRSYNGVVYDYNAAIFAGGNTTGHVTFSHDGKHIFAMTSGTMFVRRIDLGTAWDLSTATYNSANQLDMGALVGLADTNSFSQIAFDDTGNKMFVILGEYLLYEVEMVTPYDIANAVYQNTNLNLRTLANTPNSGGQFRGMTFSNDGFRLLISDVGSDKIAQLNLNFAYSLTGVTAFETTQYDPPTDISGPCGIYLKPDETKMFIADLGLDGVFEIDIAENWTDPTDFTYNGNYVKFYNTTQSYALESAHFSLDGKKLFVLTDNANKVYQFDLRIPWDINSMVFDNKDLTLGGTTPHSIYVSPDGTKLYISDSGSDIIMEYAMSTPNDISTASFVKNTAFTSLPSGTTVPRAPMYFKSDGTRFFLGDSNNVRWWDLTTPWDLSTATNYAVQNLASYLSSLTQNRDIRFSERGDVMYVLEEDADIIYQIRLSTPWLPSSGSAPSTTVSYTSQTSVSRGFALSRDSNKIYLLDTSSHRFIYEYEAYQSLSAGDIRDGFTSGTAGSSTAKYGIWAKSDGTRAYFLNNSNTIPISQFDMSTPWDVTTASNLTTVNFNGKGAVSTNCFAMALSSDGAKLYFVDYSGGHIFYQYNLSTPWDITSAPDAPTKTFDSAQGDFYEIHVSPDGEHILANDRTFNVIRHYTMTNGDVDTMVLQSDTISSAVTGVAANSDGTQIYTVTSSSSFGLDLTVYNLSTPWDLSTAGTPFSVDLGFSQPIFYMVSLYVSPDDQYMGIGSSQYQMGFAKLNDIPQSITWPSNLSWEGGAAPEFPLLNHSKVFDIYTTDGGTTYNGVERVSSAYKPTSLY